MNALLIIANASAQYWLFCINRVFPSLCKQSRTTLAINVSIAFVYRFQRKQFIR